MDAETVVRAQDGDHEAFAALAAESIDHLYRVARLIVRDASIAEDVVQDTLLEAWRGLPGLRDPDRFEAWLHRLLVRACIRAGSRRRRNMSTEVRLLEQDAPTTGDAQRALLMRDLVGRGFRRLAPDQRALLVLRYYLDLSESEIASLVGVPAGTVKSRLHRASVEMRAALEADERIPSLAARGVE
jgi:RNA polymerase sigma-70 factor, ECF subfamily